MDSAYTLHIDPIHKNNGRFKKGNVPWNKGLSWEEQGFTEERKQRVINQLRENRKKNTYKNTSNHFKKPVIQLDKYGDRLHWYESSEAAARKLGLWGRNIRKVCDGVRNTTGGFRFKWDDNFL